MEAFPSRAFVDARLSELGITTEEMTRAFAAYRCPAALTAGQGYQMSIAADLEPYLERTLSRDGLRGTRSRYELTYSPTLNQHADFALVHAASKRRIYFEIEFRPNYEKDLVKFQIGQNAGLLAAAVMVVAIDRRTINPQPPLYPSMPEYRSVVNVVRQLAPSYPLLVVGVLGAHAA